MGDVLCRGGVVFGGQGGLVLWECCWGGMWVGAGVGKEVGFSFGGVFELFVFFVFEFVW